MHTPARRYAVQRVTWVELWKDQMILIHLESPTRCVGLLIFASEPLGCQAHMKGHLEAGAQEQAGYLQTL